MLKSNAAVVVVRERGYSHFATMQKVSAQGSVEEELVALSESINNISERPRRQQLKCSPRTPRLKWKTILNSIGWSRLS